MPRGPEGANGSRELSAVARRAEAERAPLKSSRVGEGAVAAFGGAFAYPFSCRTNLHDLVSDTESRPITERPASPRATVGRNRNQRRGIERRQQVCLSGRWWCWLGAGSGKQESTDQDCSGKHRLHDRPPLLMHYLRMQAIGL